MTSFVLLLVLNVIGPFGETTYPPTVTRIENITGKDACEAAGKRMVQQIGFLDKHYKAEFVCARISQ